MNSYFINDLLNDNTTDLTSVDLGLTTGGIDVQVDRLGLILSRADGSRIDIAQRPDPDAPLNDHAIQGTSADDQLYGGPGHDYIYGGQGGDFIAAGAGNDHVWGQSPNGGLDGNDVIAAGDGDDYVQANAGNDIVDGGAGNDRLFGGAGDDVLLGGTGDDHINGNFGKDTISGGDGNDELRGGKDDDRLYGGAGNDHLYGDLGADTMTGGTGADVFHFSGNDAAFVSTDLATGHIDTITDFTAEDRLAIGYQPHEVLHAQAATLADAAASATALMLLHGGDAVAVQVGGDTALFYSSGGGNAPDSVIDLSGVQASSITNGSFI